MDDSWIDGNLNRVSVIQFQEELRPEEEDDEAAAERRVRGCGVVRCSAARGDVLHAEPLTLLLVSQGLQRRATPHPSELKVMKRGIEERRNEGYIAKPEATSPSDEVRTPILPQCWGYTLCMG